MKNKSNPKPGAGLSSPALLAAEYFAGLGPAPDRLPASETLEARQARRRQYLDKISPARSLRYSPGLYAFLTAKRNDFLAQIARAYRTADGIVVIGYLDDCNGLVGSRLHSILRDGGDAVVGRYANIPVEEIQGFWTRYLVDGRCALDPGHTDPMLNMAGRWRVVGKKRSCQWCGSVSQTLVKRERVIVEEVWEKTP